MMRAASITDDALQILRRLGVHQLPDGLWAFTDVDTARNAYVHHSTWPAALCAYAAVDTTFAADRRPGWTLIEMMHKVPSMDGGEKAALAATCGSPVPAADYHIASAAFGSAVWEIIGRYELAGCFQRMGQSYGSGGEHYKMRPRGMDWIGDGEILPDQMAAMRKAYRSMTPIQQVMVLTLLHLYLTRPDKHFLLGGCKTKVLAADALRILQEHDDALPLWGTLVSNYVGW
ncbi:MAG: hypothetical protein EPN79_16120 [Burkholderiaceae bacterium]|nr:MAG: hypothetical protein EPN79_16120 [Burkholderiaceae bacterium]